MTEFKNMLGRTMVAVMNVDSEELRFEASDGAKFRFYHENDCCETVTIEDVAGDLNDLVGSPLLLAEEVSCESGDDPDGYGTETWTFYKFATVKGAVTVRWHGSSNGYYSENVDYSEELPS